jgi:ribosomal protein S18 acetylase RimI-like enzyme
VDDVTFQEFEAAELAEWLARSTAAYIEQRVAAGDTAQEATENAAASMRDTFPDGSPAPGQLAGKVLSGDQPVGELWIGRFGRDPARWWVWNIEIGEEFRGRGLGRRTMLLAEEIARANGATSLGLNVFAHNEVARALYSSLGYRESSVQMRKGLA